MPADLTTRYLGFELANPLVVGACPLTADLTMLQRLEMAGAAAVVLPSLFEEQIAAADVRQGTPGPARYGPLASVDRLDEYNTGPDGYLRHVEQAKAALSIPVLASLNGATRTGWARFAELIEGAGADAIELNIFFVPTDTSTSGEEVEERYVEIVQTVRDAVALPLSVKIGPYFSALPRMAQRLGAAGASGLVLFNRYLEPEFDLDRLEIRPHLEFSREAELRLPLRWIAILRDQVSLSLAATSGIQSVQDVLKALLAGADAAMLASALLRHGPGHLERLRDGLRQWLDSHGVASVAEIQGRLSLARSDQGDALQLANYLEALASFATSFR